jgi:hypothetical protein
VKREFVGARREESVMDWEPIKRTGKPDPRSVDERTGTTRIVLHFPISASPPREWREFFESRHRGQEYPPLSIQEAEIIVLPLDSAEDFITWTENVDRDIQLANEYYVTVLVEREQERNVAQYAEEERLRKLEQARTWTEQLEPPA